MRRSERHPANVRPGLRHFGTLRWEIGSAKHGSRTEIRRAQKQIMPLAGAETKNRTFMQSPAAQRPGLMMPRRDTERLQRTFQILWRGFALRPGCDPEGGNLSVAGMATSFSLKSSLPLSWWLPSRSSLPSSLSWPCRPLQKKWLSEHSHAVHRHAQH